MVGSPPADVGDVASIPGSGRFHIAEEQLNPCAATAEIKCRSY